MASCPDGYEREADVTRGDSHSLQRAIGLSLLLLTAYLSPLAAQVPADLARERASFAAWLSSAANSPYAAIIQQPIGPGVTLGPSGSDVPLDGLAGTRVVESGGIVTLTQGADHRTLPRNRLVPLGSYHAFISGDPGRTLLAIYGRATAVRSPDYFAYDPGLGLLVALTAPQQRASHRILTLDGLEALATEAGMISVPIGSSSAHLTVYRVPDSDSEESDLEIYFRDASSGHGSYPAGRFVSLIPAPDGRFRLDFNRARNPFCAYSSVYACPAPWPGNSLPAAITAGERYDSAH